MVFLEAEGSPPPPGGRRLFHPLAIPQPFDSPQGPLFNRRSQWNQDSTGRESSSPTDPQTEHALEASGVAFDSGKGLWHMPVTQKACWVAFYSERFFFKTSGVAFHSGMALPRTLAVSMGRGV